MSNEGKSLFSVKVSSSYV